MPLSTYQNRDDVEQGVDSGSPAHLFEDAAQGPILDPCQESTFGAPHEHATLHLTPPDAFPEQGEGPYQSSVFPSGREFHAGKERQGRIASAAGVALTKLFAVTSVPVGCREIHATASLFQGKDHGQVQLEAAQATWGRDISAANRTDRGVSEFPWFPSSWDLCVDQVAPKGWYGFGLPCVTGNFMQIRASTTEVIHSVAELRRGRGLYQDPLLRTKELQSMARQNYVSGKVALIRGFWIYEGFYSEGYRLRKVGTAFARCGLGTMRDPTAKTVQANGDKLNNLTDDIYTISLVLIVGLKARAITVAYYTHIKIFSPDAIAVSYDLLDEHLELGKRLDSLANVRRYILDHGILDGKRGGPYDTILLAICKMIAENQRRIVIARREPWKLAGVEKPIDARVRMTELRGPRIRLLKTLKYILRLVEQTKPEFSLVHGDTAGVRHRHSNAVDAGATTSPGPEPLSSGDDRDSNEAGQALSGTRMHTHGQH
ncbi:hypothetical protein G7Y89_g5391 [Cudoniella acicularis]|uniref:Uncharacterized protein n=1 Tax=Cudoniella acicularis TaxID=354080 RepID=A0A8H4RPU4_9HELO|nr:hypothetical protein G7Y89_g5391 [Cudoniella acicularis]